MIIYHDVWYKIGRTLGENERESAAWAERDLKGLVQYSELQCICNGILSSISHKKLACETTSNWKLQAVFLDLDLWGLGQKADHFRHNTARLWQESIPHKTKIEFDAGNRKWATGFLERQAIYQSGYFKVLEVPARANLYRLAHI